MIYHFLFIMGLVLTAYGSVGMICARNNFQRIHFFGIADTLGAGLIMLGVATKWTEAFPRVLFVFFLSLVTGSIMAHVFAKSMFERSKRC
ncbi:monovalent cation/H(+) antiporter subunit G [Candidatus Caldatribacterium saccharofermentans]|uniref:Sodium:proton antiporter n=1 Tax=Candidatus Caldatribacterium saccharofermentans TaxID=1454753 RepID=A0A7V4TFM1_9BACT